MLESGILLITELIGTVAFSVSGALIAIRGGLDLFGVTLVGCVTTFGGGMLRDVLLGRIPPAVFSRLELPALAVITSLLVFLIAYLNVKKFETFRRRIETVNNIFDAVGLAAFSVIGTEAAFSEGFGDRAVLCISMGLLTGIGGGILRDVLVDQTPSVLRKHIYALASIFGSLVYYLIHLYVDQSLAVLIAMPLVVLIRMIATRFQLTLPKVKLPKK